MTKNPGLMMIVLIIGGSACGGDAFTTFGPGYGGNTTGGTAGSSGSSKDGGSSGSTGGNSGQSGKDGGPGGNGGDSGNAGGTDGGNSGEAGSGNSGSGGGQAGMGGSSGSESGGSSGTAGTGGSGGNGGQAGMGGSGGNNIGGSSGSTGGNGGDSGSGGSNSSGGAGGQGGLGGGAGMGGSGGDPCMAQPVPDSLTISCTNACTKVLVFNGAIVPAKSSADNSECETIPFTNKPVADDSVYAWVDTPNPADLDMFKATSLGKYPKTCFMKCKAASPNPGPAPDHSEMESEIFAGGYITVPCGSNPEISVSQTCAFGMNVIAQY